VQAKPSAPIARGDLVRALDAVPDADAQALYRAALDALRAGLNREVASRLGPVLDETVRDPRLWQLHGLALRGLQDSAGAHRALARAAQLAPADPLIAHSLARSALEAGFPAVALFDRARQIAPRDAGIILGTMAALHAEERGGEALARLEPLLEGQPGWIEGHHAYARIAAICAAPGAETATIEAAVHRQRTNVQLWQVLIQVHLEARDYCAARDAIERARGALGAHAEFNRLEAICLGELGQAAAAQRLFDPLPMPANGETAVWPIRNLIRLGRYDQARLLAENSFNGISEAALWPYRSLLWRLLDDPRWHWLEGDPRMIGIFDIASEVGSIDDLAALLRTLHRGTRQPLDQSVRGGTQTDGNLLARADPAFRTLRAALLEAARAYAAQLPPPDPSHPVLLSRREPLDIAGSWSVRLTDRGFHADHVHWQGWISSAFYVVVPEEDPAVPEAGCLAFGQCQDVLPDLPAFRVVKPQPGKLALFPSIMWHGTRPFGSGERMTVAFDISRPGQE
jgi:Tfp pilus assembly protein PilF